MFKMIDKKGAVLKSDNINDLCDKIIDNHNGECHFFNGYTLLTDDDFLKTYLTNTKNYTKYLELFRLIKSPRKNLEKSNPKLYLATKKPMSIFNYVKSLQWQKITTTH